jgi:hypothetical protein
MDATASEAEADRFLESLVGGRDPERLGPAALESLRGRAARHGLSGLVISRAEGLSLPEPVLDGIREDWGSARALATVLGLETRRVAAAAPPGVPTAILLKGPAVASRYGDPAIRTFVDVDLLVPVDDLPVWRTALEGIGYTGPSDWETRSALRYHHHLVFTRPGPGAPLAVEMHWRLFAERRARALDHAALAAHADPGDDGLLRLSAPAQLVALAVHLAHHPPETFRYQWVMDFVELGGPGDVEAARKLAGRHGVGWALEDALAAAERAVGEARWGARPEPAPRGRLAEARRTDARGVRLQIARIRELGPREGLLYALGRLDPRRFRGADGRMDWTAFRAWIGRARRGD